MQWWRVRARECEVVKVGIMGLGYGGERGIPWEWKHKSSACAAASEENLHTRFIVWCFEIFLGFYKERKNPLPPFPLPPLIAHHRASLVLGYGHL